MAAPRAFWIMAMLVAIAATQGAVMAVRQRYEPRVNRAPNEPLQNLPLTLGEWTSDTTSPADTGMKDAVFVALGAEEAITRTYSHPTGLSCSVHLATWHESDEWTPHPPDLCYKGAGYSIRERSQQSLPDQPNSRVRTSNYLAPDSGVLVHTIYWYQMGRKSYFDRDSARPIRRSFWGSPERPPLVKVLMQCNESVSAERDQTLQELASSVYEFAAGL